MKEEELRIGNYYDHHGKIEKVTPNTILEVWKAERIWCKPIPLTPEILVRLGAQKDTETDYRWFMLDGSITIDIDDFGACVGSWWLDRTIEHLHQLQNLYFALTDRELTYTP
jgi:hypothetical protein